MLLALGGPVGEGGDEVRVARFIADRRTNYRVPHPVACALLGVSVARFYRWLGRASGPSAASGLHSPRNRRRETCQRTAGSPCRRTVHLPVRGQVMSLSADI